MEPLATIDVEVLPRVGDDYLSLGGDTYLVTGCKHQTHNNIVTTIILFVSSPFPNAMVKY